MSNVLIQQCKILFYLLERCGILYMWLDNAKISALLKCFHLQELKIFVLKVPLSLKQPTNQSLLPLEEPEVSSRLQGRSNVGSISVYNIPSQNQAK